MGRGGSSGSSSSLSNSSWGISWTTEDFVEAHKAVKASGMFNFEGCRIPIPTAIRFDRIKEALGNEVSPKEERILSLQEIGMPIGCKPNFGVKNRQKNHFQQ